MKKTIQIPQGNEFSLFVPFVVLSKNGREDASAALWNNVQVVVHMSNKSELDIPHTTNLQEQYVVISFDNSLKLGSYDVIISGEYEGRNVSAPLNNLFSITNWADGNYAEFVVGQPIECPTQTIIGQFNTTQEIEELTQELRDALAAAEAAKEEYEEKVEELSDVAQQTTLTEGIADIRGDIAGISIDTSTIAKQGSNASATLTATQTAATNAYASAEAAKTATVDGNDTAVGVAKEIRGEVGTGSDTAAETGTLFAVVKWVKDKVKSIFNLIGSPATGQPATLFAAIAAGGGGSDDGKQTIADAINQMGGTATASMTWAQLGQQIEELETISPNTIFTSGVIKPINVGDFCATSGMGIKEITSDAQISITAYAFASNTTLESVTFAKATSISMNMFNSCTNLKKVSIPLANNTSGGYNFTNDTNIEEVYLPKVTALGTQEFRYCSKLMILDIYSLATAPASFAFGQCTNLIDLIIGSNFTSSVNINNGSYNPSNAYANNISTLCFDTDQEKYGQTFNNNFEKWKWCIINHFAANLQDRTGLTAYTITFGSTVLNKFDSDMITAFTSKNWTLA